MENKDIRLHNLLFLMDKLLREEGLNKTQFAERCGTSASTLSQITSDKTGRNLGDALARKIESSLDLPLGWMDSMHHNAEPAPNDVLEEIGMPKEGIIPVIGEAVLGMDGTIDMMEFHAGWLRIYSPDVDAYGVRVKGDSMWPRIQSGEFVVIEPNTKIHPGDEVFVRTHEGHNMIKIFNTTREGDLHFTSVNNAHQPITMPASEVDKIHYVSGILKSTRFISADDVTEGD